MGPLCKIYLTSPLHQWQENCYGLQRSECNIKNSSRLTHLCEGLPHIRLWTAFIFPLATVILSIPSKGNFVFEIYFCSGVRYRYHLFMRRFLFVLYVGQIGIWFVHRDGTMRLMLLLTSSVVRSGVTSRCDVISDIVPFSHLLPTLKLVTPTSKDEYGTVYLIVFLRIFLQQTLPQTLKFYVAFLTIRWIESNWIFLLEKSQNSGDWNCGR